MEGAVKRHSAHLPARRVGLLKAGLCRPKTCVCKSRICDLDLEMAPAPEAEPLRFACWFCFWTEQVANYSYSCKSALFLSGLGSRVKGR